MRKYQKFAKNSEFVWEHGDQFHLILTHCYSYVDWAVDVMPRRWTSLSERPLKTSVQIAKIWLPLSLFRKMSALVHSPPPACPCGHIIKFKKSEVFFTKKCERSHSEEPPWLGRLLWTVPYSLIQYTLRHNTARIVNGFDLVFTPIE